MPDDPILDAASAPQAPATEGSPPVNPPAAPSGISREEVAEIVAGALGPLAQSVQALASQRQEPVAPPTLAGDAEEAFANDFYKAPRATLQRVIAEYAKPIISQQAEMTTRAFFDTKRSEIDAEYGPGTWDAMHGKELDPVFEALLQQDPTQLNLKAVTNAINTISGRPENIKALFERRTKHTAATTKATEDQRTELKRQLFAESPNLSGGFRDTSNKPQLTEEQRGILADMKKAGNTTRDPALLAAMMNGGDTIEEYRALKKSLNGTTKGAQQ